MKKFELTQNKKNWEGRTLYQIKACTSFTTNSGIEISAGELGGWVEKEQNLSQRGKAWIWSDTKIYGAAKVYGNAQIFGNAVIRGNAKVYGNAIICGDSKISGYAKVCGNAEIWGYAKVYGNAEISENALIWGYSEIYGNAKICGNAEIFGYAKVYDNAEIWGDVEIWDYSEIYGCSKVFGDAKIGGDAFISSPDDILTITPLGKYRVSLTLFKTKNNSIKVSYNWDIYTLEKFQSVMNDWTEKEQKIVKAAIEILGGNE